MLFVWGGANRLWLTAKRRRVVEIDRTEFVFSRDQKMKPRYTMGCGPSTKSADPADARETSRRIARRGRLDFRAQWDGFRALVFRDGDEIFIQSRDEKTTQSLLS